MKVSDLLPSFYDENVEMQAIINSEEYELENNLKANIDNSFIDTFAIIATEKGIENFEKIFNIKPDVLTETLEFRRQRVMNRLVSAIPYTERFLINKLNSMLGVGQWSYTIDYDTYTLNIQSLIPGRSWYRELLDFLDRIIPCNIDWKVNVYSATWALVKDAYNTWDEIKEMTWQELEDAEWSK